MARKIQNADVKTAADLTGAGGTIAELINDTKIYVSADSLNKSLFDAIEDGDLSGGGSSSGLAASGVTSVKSSNYTVLSGDNGKVIPVDTSGGSVSITLPAPSAGFTIIIKDLNYTSATNNILIIRNGSEKIDEVAVNDVIETNGNVVSYISNGTDWFRVALFTGNQLIASLNRGLFGGGTGLSNVIDYITITTTGNATDFGDILAARRDVSALGNRTRAVFGGGDGPSNVMQYVAFATLGNAVSFGNLSVARGTSFGLASDTRGLFGGGDTGSPSNVIDYITIASVGNAIDFGDLTTSRDQLAGCQSSTRGIWGGGNNSNVIDYITIATTGNATDFGDLTVSRYPPGGASSDTRGLFAGGPGNGDVIDYITIATTGNATDFGNLTVGRSQIASACTKIRGTFAGGNDGSDVNIIDYVTIASVGDATDFGDLTVARRALGGCSDSHGGLV